jgi:hypothetical protein
VRHCVAGMSTPMDVGQGATGFGRRVPYFIRVEGFWDEDRFLIGRFDIITKP